MEKRYVRVEANFYDNYNMLSNEKKYKIGDYIWLEVEPIKLLVDEETDIALSEKLLFAGIQFNNQIGYKGDFNNTNIYKFLNTYFIRDILQNWDRYINSCNIPNKKMEYKRKKV